MTDLSPELRAFVEDPEAVRTLVAGIRAAHTSAGWIACVACGSNNPCKSQRMLALLAIVTEERDIARADLLQERKNLLRTVAAATVREYDLRAERDTARREADELRAKLEAAEETASLALVKLGQAVSGLDDEYTRAEAAEAILAAVRALRDELLNQRDDAAHYTMEHRTAFEWVRVKLDAALTGKEGCNTKERRGTDDGRQ